MFLTEIKGMQNYNLFRAKMNIGKVLILGHWAFGQFIVNLLINGCEKTFTAEEGTILDLLSNFQHIKCSSSLAFL